MVIYCGECVRELKSVHLPDYKVRCGRGALFILGFLAWMFARVSYCGLGLPQVVSVGWINVPTKRSNAARAGFPAKNQICVKQKKFKEEL